MANGTLWRCDRGGGQYRGGLNGRGPERAAPTGLGGRCGLRAGRPLCSLPLTPGRCRWGGMRPETGSAGRCALILRPALERLGKLGIKATGIP